MTKNIKIYGLLLFLLAGHFTYGQTFYSELYGFKIGQYRTTAKLELGSPFQYGKLDDGFVYEVFLLKPDTSLYIVFEYASYDTEIIWSIQVTGYNTSTELGFKNAKLGLDKDQTEQIFGKPTSIEDIGDYGQKWEYENTNLSLEVNTYGRFSSIKILDNSKELFPEPDFSKIPTFEKIQQTLSSQNNEDISKLLSGDIEIYHNKVTYFFKKSFKTELKTDYSKIFSVIREISKDLSTINTKNINEYEENMRLTYGADMKHVIKIKKGHIIKEIVFKYFGGEYLIYEINAQGN